jgi:hypothetical protein
MAGVREAIANGELLNTAANRRGFNVIELFDCISIYQCIYPILHAEIGLGNKILNSFFDWIDFRIEKVTNEEKDLRKDLVES